MKHLTRLTLTFLAPLLLTGCLVTPGKFTSSLDIRADRSFTFTYQGEVIVINPDDLSKAGGGAQGDDAESGGVDSDASTASLYWFAAAEGTAQTKKPPATPDARGGDAGLPDANRARMEAIAEALTKEKGYRSARYVGDNIFLIDYRISGRLDHGFVYPFNSDAAMVFPFIAIELRGDDRVRVKAPGYANQDAMGSAFGMGGGMPGGMTAGKSSGGDADKAAERLDGSFTLTTNAEIVSQNQEDGVKAVPAGHSMTWRVTPLTRVAPTAVLKLAPLP